MSNLLVFLIGILALLPPASRDGAEAGLREQVRGELGQETRISYEYIHDDTPLYVVTISDWETDIATISEARLVIPQWGPWCASCEHCHCEHVDTTPPPARFRLTLDGDALLGSLQYPNAGIVADDVEIRRRSVIISGSANIGMGYPVPVRIEGVPLKKGDFLAFKVEKAYVFGFRLPASINGLFNRGGFMLLDLEELDIDYFICEEADEMLGVDIEPVIRKWELKKGSLVVSGNFRAKKY